MLTEMTQSATGFFSALSAVSFSLVSSIPVTCSTLNTFSSSRYITWKHQEFKCLKNKKTSKKITVYYFEKEGTIKKQKTKKNQQQQPYFDPSRSGRHLGQVVHQVRFGSLDIRVCKSAAMESLETLYCVFEVGHHLEARKGQRVLHPSIYLCS